MSPTDTYTLSIVVPTFNRLPYLKTALESIYSELNGLSFEIIVVDGNSDDGTADYLLGLKKHKDNIVLCHQAKLLGVLNAFKAGLGLATGKYVIIRHDHSFTKKDPIIKACQLMDTVPQISLVFEKTYKYPNSVYKALEPEYAARYFSFQEAFIFRRSHDFPIDEQFVSYGWQTDWAARYLAMGGVITGLKQCSVIDTAITHADVLHEKFKNPNSDHSNRDGDLMATRLELLYKETQSSLRLYDRIKAKCWQWLTFKCIYAIAKNRPGQILSKLFHKAGYRLMPIVPTYDVESAGPTLQVPSLDNRLAIPYFEPFFDKLHERCCPFVNNSLIPYDLRPYFYLTRQLPPSLVSKIKKRKIWP